MNGPEHYAEAERIVDYAEDEAFANSDAWYANAMAAAQVHATLALAAATALGAAVGDHAPETKTADAWTGVLS